MNGSVSNRSGYTLVELLVTLVVASVLMAGVYGAYRMHSRTRVTQERLVDMIQTARFGIAVMEREIRMAAYDPEGTSGASIVTADAGELIFTCDLNDDGNPNPTPETDPGERIRYALTNDANRDGLADGTPCHLGREVWNGGLQPIVENVDALNFVYIDGGDPPSAMETPVANTGAVRAVQVTVVARTGDRLPASFIDYNDNRAYLNQQGESILAAPNDSFRRVLMTAEVKCRNLAFEDD